MRRLLYFYRTRSLSTVNLWGERVRQPAIESGLTVLVVIAVFPCLARTWHVPGDAPTIQAANDMAESGDDVLVAPVEYFEHDIVMKAGVWGHREQGSSATTMSH